MNPTRKIIKRIKGGLELRVHLNIKRLSITDMVNAADMLARDMASTVNVPSCHRNRTMVVHTQRGMYLRYQVEHPGSDSAVNLAAEERHIRAWQCFGYKRR